MATMRKTEALQYAALICATTGGINLTIAALTQNKILTAFWTTWILAGALTLLLPNPTQHKIATALDTIWKAIKRPIDWVARRIN